MTYPTEVKLPESLEVVAYLTTDEEGSPAMLFFDQQEAGDYCNLDEQPEALVRLSDAESALKARDAEIERLRGALSAILSDSLDANSETNVPPALYAQGVAAIDQARAEGGEKTNG